MIKSPYQLPYNKTKGETGVKRCECDLGATGPLCEHRCCRDVGAHGSCRIIPEDGCDCERNYTGKNCETRIEVPDIFCNCVHGSCNEAGTCKCYEGWTGATCEISCTDNCGQGKLIVCQCDIGVAPGQLCEHKCCKDCGAHGRCYYNVTQKEERCNCDANYTGSLCEIYNPPVKNPEVEKVHWWFYLIVILIPILLMTLLTALFLMYLWKRRVIVVLKAVRLFQAYEDDGNK
ncbi:tenascin-like [Dreissena polymorpha]|uniref:tenascin-like n=1 Tax=Dreissena polymorpha TaxID=45954 RepID=UPI00226532B8|nr:tenascin-like [Dreissena polymorpha]